MKQNLNELANNLISMVYSYYDGESKDHNEICKDVIYFVENVPKFAPLKPHIDEVVQMYEDKHGIKTYEFGSTLVAKKTDESWLDKAREDCSHDYANRYRDFLIADAGGGLGMQAADYIMKEAEIVLSHCADPTSQDKKLGLVMGDVQSGKTANYLALANMALDYGYKLVLILSGITETLRRQTQGRVDDGVVGAISSTIGYSPEYTLIGRPTNSPPDYYAIPLTSDIEDFARIDNFNPKDFNKPQILVVKKNKKILENVKTWLKPGSFVSSDNILIIDDECDNASVNTKSDVSPTTINRLIREIFNNFSCATYVGYTATPFANIFIKPNSSASFMDLFPQDFIHRIKTSSEDYFGVKKVFQGDDSFIEILDEEEPNFIPAKHNKFFEVRVLPNSLKNAVCTFLLCCCVRTLRGDVKKHRSMMVNVSRFNDVHQNVADALERYITFLSETLPLYTMYSSSKFCKNEELKRIYDIYENSSTFDISRQTIGFKEIQNLLCDEIKQFQVRQYNDKVKKDEVFRYDDYKKTGARVIVVGGLALSRGLTLEGLMISYYNRNAEAYDTLLQMCRWFGYRNNYEDLCKIYMTTENYDRFVTVIQAIEDLDEQFENMVVLNKTPRDYGLMVLESPDILETKLIVTSRNKSKSAREIEVTINFSGAVIDPNKLYKGIERVKSNEELVKNMVKTLTANNYKLIEINSRHLFKNIPSKYIADFVANVSVPPENKKFYGKSLASMIASSERYPYWDIVFATGSGSENSDDVPQYKLYDCNGEECLSIRPPQRTFSYDADEEYITFYKSNNRLVDPRIFNAGLNEKQLEEAEENRRERIESEGASDSNPIAKDYLKVHGRNPLLVIMPIYPLAAKNKSENETSPLKEDIVKEIKASGSFVIGFGLGFPGDARDRYAYKYLANGVKLEEMISEEEDEGYED